MPHHEHCKKSKSLKRDRGLEITASLIILIMVIVASINVFLLTSNRDVKVNSIASTAEWVRTTYLERETYQLKSNGVYLSIKCKNGKIVTTSLDTLSTVTIHVSEQSTIRNSRLSNIVIDGKLWYIPIIQDANNPSAEQVELLNHLGKANIIGFDHGNNRYVWSVKNATTFKYCLNRKDEK